MHFSNTSFKSPHGTNISMNSKIDFKLNTCINIHSYIYSILKLIVRQSDSKTVTDMLLVGILCLVLSLIKHSQDSHRLFSSYY